MALTDGRKVVTTAGTRVVLGTGGTNPARNTIAITAETDNTGIVVVGASTVVATVLTRQGVPLSPGATVVIQGVSESDIWLDSTVNGDGVTWIAT
jgi:hypothetical protein